VSDYQDKDSGPTPRDEINEHIGQFDAIAGKVVADLEQRAVQAREEADATARAAEVARSKADELTAAARELAAYCRGGDKGRRAHLDVPMEVEASPEKGRW